MAKYARARQLIHKEDWSAEDIARARIANTAYQYEQRDNSKHIVPPEKIREWTAQLEADNDEDELAMYQTYMILLDSILSKKWTAIAQIQQAQMRAVRLLNEASSCKAIETSYLSVQRESWGELAQSTWGNVMAPLADFSLAAYYDDNPAAEANIGQVMEDKDAFSESCYSMLVYNTGLDLIADIFSLEDVTAFKIPFKSIDGYIERYNRAISELRSLVDADPDPEIQAKKVQVLNTVFKPLKRKKRLPQHLLDAARATVGIDVPFTFGGRFFNALYGRGYKYE